MAGEARSGRRSLGDTAWAFLHASKVVSVALAFYVEFITQQKNLIEIKPKFPALAEIDVWAGGGKTTLAT